LSAALPSWSGLLTAHDRHRHRERLPSICQTDFGAKMLVRARPAAFCLSRFPCLIHRNVLL
jgi:hypothetical protein